MRLVIVESPTKAKTIKQFLGKDYSVESSFGHVRDLPEQELAIDIEHNFKPKYVIIPKARKTINQLREKAKKSKSIILATDEDREGEAIAWHLIKALGLDELKIKNEKLKIERIVFHEITKSAIEEAFKNPRGLDIKLVTAQQARRILDRLVGYKLSPLLWKKVARGLSAGRVQSVAVRLVVERQKEIDEFKPEEYWVIEAEFKNKPNFIAVLTKKDNKIIPRLSIKTKIQAEEIVKDLKKAKYRVDNIEKGEIQRYPLPPFTTSTLQQEASRKLKFSAKQTMFIAQQLYEGIPLEKKKSVGLITYMRTDSLNLASQAIWKIRDLIERDFGKNYLPLKPNFYKTRTKGAQEAHEAIRTTFPERKPEDIKEFLSKGQFALYDLIWRRTIACQMKPAVFDTTKIDIKTDKIREKHIYQFRTNGSVLKFDGFLKVWPMKNEDVILPELKKNELLELIKLIPSQHFTQAPFPYTEATLVKALEENGIGRPSTYAPILETIQKRGYVVKKARYLYPADIGILVNNLLVEHFPKIVDIGFTAKMEEELDEIAEGKKKWVPVIDGFYRPFEENLKKKYQEIDKKEITEEKSDEICEKCGAPMIVKIGRFGKFLACSNFPKCRNTKNIEKTLGIKCPQCDQGEITERMTKRGKIFYGCTNYPNCNFATWNKPTGEKCPKCNSLLVKIRGNKVKCSNRECDYIKE
ncbi:MAG: type I DNA topoisomerase [Candidatus Portnoybacteria bacterium CG10_big_fil_rev_8_21_14_0_10_38_18]|uniref:DNA topoisomerase 1 n=1 Tax=Candidatus Portnoybacteria bacterium CG10_big_fil_rev_8_21_14_0_10_38_18 TaxID=1974813 RepID=A0A2M8KCR1_9BACT|nr:MAG: type I DNA topoisomerase [Candidatus Portnoybacteria bacterium CG10_big_fil_rev_8_21_14_0_10_38_18]